VTERGKDVQVSVVIPAYNVAGFIGRAIASVQAQAVGDWEIIVVDDASADGTADIVRAMAAVDPRIRLLRQDRNRGPSAARNRAIAAAAGDWIAVLDADDAWRPERLARLLATAAETGADFIADNPIRFDLGAGAEAGPVFALAGPRIALSVAFMLDGRNPIQYGLMKPLMSRSFLEARGLRYDERLRACEDLLLYIDLMMAGAQAVILNEGHYLYTMRRGALSGERSAASRSTTSAAQLVLIADTVASRYRRVLSAREHRLVQRLRNFSVQRWIAQELTARRRAGRHASAAVLAARHPLGAIRYILSSPRWRRLLGADPRQAAA
jgi:succinoglycan biosynthesis protein ExoO